MTGYYYRRLGADGDCQTFESTDITCSNWDPAIQHGSPPLALLTRSIIELLGDSPMRPARLTLDILGAIPVAPVKVRAWVQRPGRRISLLMAETTPAGDDGARPVARVTAWALATSDTSDVASDRYPPLVEGPAQPLPAEWWGLTGYLGSVTASASRAPRSSTEPGSSAPARRSCSCNVADQVSRSRYSGFISCSIVGTSSLTVGWMCMVRASVS